MRRSLRRKACAAGKARITLTSIGITDAALLLSSLGCRSLLALLTTTTIRPRWIFTERLMASTIIAPNQQATTQPYRNVRTDGGWYRRRVDDPVRNWDRRRGRPSFAINNPAASPIRPRGFCGGSESGDLFRHASACRSRLCGSERLLRVDQRTPAVSRLVGVIADQCDNLVGRQFRIDRDDLRGQVDHLWRRH
jgi:hypothetical protein